MDQNALTVYAWIGEDPFTSTPELQQAAAAGTMPLVAIRRSKIDRGGIVRQLQEYADRHGVEVQLVTFRQVDTLRVLRPRAGRRPALKMARARPRPARLRAVSRISRCLWLIATVGLCA